MARVFLAAAVIALAAVAAEANCLDFFLKGCAGDPQQYQCLQVTTSLSSAKGGEPATIEQEDCFGHNGNNGSPLPDKIEVIVDRGTLDVSKMTPGVIFGLVYFRAKFADFGENCPIGPEAVLEAPFIVTERVGNDILFEVRIETANPPLISCLLTYDPTDANHNDGIMYTGVATPRAAGGFDMLLELGVADDGFSTAIQAGDRTDPGIPVPLTFRYIDATEAPGVFTLPAAGGKLTVSTIFYAYNGFEFEQDDTFDLQRAVGGNFRRGDVDANGTLTIGDAIALLNHMFAGDDEPVCPDAGDIDDSGEYTIGDAIGLLNFMFADGPEPPAPGTETCGADPSPDGWPPETCKDPRC